MLYTNKIMQAPKNLYSDYKKLLGEFITFESVSTDPVFKPKIRATANWLKSVFEKNGFSVHIVEGYGNPIVVAHYTVHQLLKTCLIYGHYDVQPASKEDGWKSDPFTLRESKGRLIARGAVDNKGQVSIHMATIFSLIKKKSLNYNVTFLIEGDEESGTGDIAGFLKENRDLIASDFVLISDGEISACYPTLEAGFRGVLNATLTINTSDRDLHSGLYGGAVPNAAHELTIMLDKLFDEESYTVSIPGFYENVPDVSKSQLTDSKNLPFSLSGVKSVTGIKNMLLEKGHNFHTQVGFRPTVQVTGLSSGYTGVGFRNSVPHTATAKLNFRLVPEQDPREIAKKVSLYIKQISPKHAEVIFKAGESSKGVRLDVENEYTGNVKKMMEKIYKKKVLVKHCGATLPIVTEIDRLLGVPQILAPLANEDCRMHAVDENYEIGHARKALALSWSLFEKKAK